MSRSRRRAEPLQAIPEDADCLDEQPVVDGPMGEILRLVENLEEQVESKIASIISAANDAISDLRIQCQKQMVILPKKYRDMPLKEFQEKYPEDFKSGALREIRERYAALAEEAARPVPATTARGRTASKRAAEPETVLRTVRPRRGGAAGSMLTAGPLTNMMQPAAAAAQAAAPATTRRGRGQLNSAEPSALSADIENVNNVELPAPKAPPALFNGLPLQTPLPFAGAAVALPVTMLTQKRGGRTKATAAPDAAIVTTADGKQWALGKDGVAGIPEEYRAEVEELLTAQFSFLAAALGKTVFQRPAGRGSRR